MKMTFAVEGGNTNEKAQMLDFRSQMDNKKPPYRQKHFRLPTMWKGSELIMYTVMMKAIVMM